MELLFECPTTQTQPTKIENSDRPTTPTKNPTTFLRLAKKKSSDNPDFGHPGEMCIKQLIRPANFRSDEIFYRTVWKFLDHLCFSNHDWLKNVLRITRMEK